MNNTLPEQPKHLPPPFKIKGRMIPYGEFASRLKNFCLSLGFRKLKISTPVTSMAICAAFAGAPDVCFLEEWKSSQENDAVIILSNKVQYNPSWGGYRGLPRLLVQEKTSERSELTASGFIDPYLHQYNQAKRHIHLKKTGDKEYVISLPESMVVRGENDPANSLKVYSEKLFKPNRQGDFAPLSTSGLFRSYAVSQSFIQSLDRRGYIWGQSKGGAIGKELTADLFFFEGMSRPNDIDSPFSLSLLPIMPQIVTHQTPHLRAAKLHLRQEFNRTVEALHAAGHSESRNLICIAGLDIDMSAFRKGGGEHYFVPWKAYIERGGQTSSKEYPLSQDELFVTLMQQKQQSLV